MTPEIIMSLPIIWSCDKIYVAMVELAMWKDEEFTG
jgi:hypothetical protein